MTRQVVLCKFRDEASEEEWQETIDKLSALEQSIPEVRELSIGKRSAPSSKAYDLAIVSSFENVEALERYKNHPNHIRTKNRLSKIADLAVVDYECSKGRESEVSFSAWPANFSRALSDVAIRQIFNKSGLKFAF